MPVDVHKLIQRTFRGRGVAGGIDAAISANVGTPGTTKTTRLQSRRRVVQRGGETVVDEHEVRTSTGDAPPDANDTRRS